MDKLAIKISNTFSNPLRLMFIYLGDLVKMMIDPNQL